MIIVVFVIIALAVTLAHWAYLTRKGHSLADDLKGADWSWFEDDWRERRYWVIALKLIALALVAVVIIRALNGSIGIMR